MIEEGKPMTKRAGDVATRDSHIDAREGRMTTEDDLASALRVNQAMSDVLAPECAHSVVEWRTHPNDDGTVTGWWECARGCGQRFSLVAGVGHVPVGPCCENGDFGDGHGCMKQLGGVITLYVVEWERAPGDWDYVCDQSDSRHTGCYVPAAYTTVSEAEARRRKMCELFPDNRYRVVGYRHG